MDVRIGRAGSGLVDRLHLLPRFSAAAAEANRRLADEYGARMGVPAAALIGRTRPHTLRTFLRTPIPLSALGGFLLAVLLTSLRLPAYLALPLGYAGVTALGYGVLCAAGERGMAMGARAVTYREGVWRDADEALGAIAPPLYHGWTHLAGRRGVLRLHNSLAIAAGYLRARELGDGYRVYHFNDLERSVAAGRALSGWSELEQRVAAETRGPLGWLREWTKYQFLGHSRNAYVLGGLLAGRALCIAEETQADPWLYLRHVGHGLSMNAAEAEVRRGGAEALY
jgi:hypothetical protein